MGVFNFCVKFQKGEDGVFAFLLVNFEGFLFYFLKIPKSSIFLLVILGVFNFFVWSFTRGETRYLHFFLWILKGFFLVFWNSKVFYFSYCHFRGFQFCCMKFHRGRGWLFSSFFLWTLKVFYFGILKLQNLQFFFLSFCGSSFFWCEVSQGGEMRYLPFFLWTLKFWSFGILKFWSFQFSFYHFWSFQFFVWSFTRGRGANRITWAPPISLGHWFWRNIFIKFLKKKNSWIFSLYYYVKVYVKDFKKYFI